MIAFYWALFVLFRISFFILFRDVSGDFSYNELFNTFFMGVRFDLRLAILITFPVIFLAILPRINQTNSVLIRKIASSYNLIISILIILFYMADFGHYEYLDRRLDATALIYLENPLIALRMIMESYSVILGTIFLILLILGIYFVNRLIMHKTIQKSPKRISNWQKCIGIILSGIILLIGAWGTLSPYALYWSDVQISRNSFVVAMGLNPVLYFFDTKKFQEQDYDIEKVRSHYTTMVDYLKIGNPDSEKLNFTRKVPSKKSTGNNPNIVIIMLESVGTNRLGVMGNPLNPTPNLDKIIEKALFFDKFYIPYVNTSRSVFTLITGIPDVARVKTSSRNPLVRNQNTIINDFTEYSKYYLLGGSASWANIRSLITYNIPDIKLMELGDFNRPRLDVWGISDLDLLKEAHHIFKNQSVDKPFFAIIQTASNHRPYSIPKENAGFKKLKIADELLYNAGFKSLDQFNGMRMLDHTLSHYFELAAQESYFNNTIFVIFGDHGTSDPKANHMRAANFDLKLRSYNVPLIIYKPDKVNFAQRNSTVCGLPDILPTVAGLVGISYTNRTLGRDILNSQYEKNSALIINTKLSPSSYGIINQDFYVQKSREDDSITFHKLDSAKPYQDVKTQFPKEYQELLQETEAVYETAKYLLYHNQQSTK